MFYVQRTVFALPLQLTPCLMERFFVPAPSLQVYESSQQCDLLPLFPCQ
jgi:hypothetical protein